MKASLDFDEDTAVLIGEVKTVTLHLWTDREANSDALSEEFTWNDDDEVDSETASEASSASDYVAECGAIGEEYIVCSSEIEEISLLQPKEEKMQDAVGHLDVVERYQSKLRWLKINQ